MKKFWKWMNQKILNKETKEETQERTLILNGIIAEDSWFDDEITPQIFKDELNSGTGDITVWINSPGGDCIAAAQIYNMLTEYKGKVTVKIDGIAASAASVIAMSGDKILMSPVSMLMIHNPATMAFGDHIEMKKVIEMLNGVKNSIINAYVLKTGMSRKKLSQMMDEETWMDATKAMELGFVDDIILKKDLDIESIEEDKKTSDSVLFSRKAINNKFLNKLEKHYKKASENIVKQNTISENKGRSVKEIRERLEFMNKFIKGEKINEY